MYKKVSEYLIISDNGNKYLNIYLGEDGKYLSTLTPTALISLDNNESSVFFNTEEEALKAGIKSSDLNL